MAAIANINLRRKDVVRAVFGGKGAGRAREKLERAVTTYEAFSEDRATPNFEEPDETTSAERAQA